MKRGRLSIIIMCGLILVVLCIVPVLAAYSEADREPVTLSLSNIWGGTRVPLMEEQLRRFEELYPWITVDNRG